jgi:hypothetical protein
MRVNRELKDMTEDELTKVEQACDRAISDGLIASRLGLRMAMSLSEAVARERSRRRGQRMRVAGGSKGKH